MRIAVRSDKCSGCEICVASCPFTAIIMEKGRAFITEYCQFCRACLSACPEGVIIEINEEGDNQQSAISNQQSASKGIWVFAEQRDGKLAPVSYELLGVGRSLANEVNAGLSAVLLGASEAEALELVRWGAEKVYFSDAPIFNKFNDEPYAGALAALIQEHRPEIVLAGATAIGRSFFPRVAARLGTGLTADCTSLEIEKETGNLVQVRPALGGNIMATIICPDKRPQMATVRPKVMKAGQYDIARKGEIIHVKPEGLFSHTRVVDTIKEISGNAVNLQEVDIIIAAGRGVGGIKGVKLLEEFTQTIGGAIGATRAAVDEGWIPYSHQIGQTGKTVCPKLYIACGISGAIQHTVGMQSSDIIVAINKNPDAPIFNIATYGIVGDIFEVLPALIKKLKEIKG